MATSTELLRAAEHMRNLAANRREKSACDFRMAGIAADELEREAKRLQVIEAQQPTAEDSEAEERALYERLHRKYGEPDDR